MTNTSAVLSWSPAVNGGGRPLSEIVYTITAVGECTKHYKEQCAGMCMNTYPCVSLVCESAELLCVCWRPMRAHIVVYTTSGKIISMKYGDVGMAGWK